MKNDTFTISRVCVGCGSCVGNCPVSAIQGDTVPFVILKEVCIACGICAGICPVLAIEKIRKCHK